MKTWNDYQEHLIAKDIDEIESIAANVLSIDAMSMTEEEYINHILEGIRDTEEGRYKEAHKVFSDLKKDTIFELPLSDANDSHRFFLSRHSLYSIDVNDEKKYNENRKR